MWRQALRRSAAGAQREQCAKLGQDDEPRVCGFLVGVGIERTVAQHEVRSDVEAVMTLDERPCLLKSMGKLRFELVQDRAWINTA